MGDPSKTEQATPRRQEEYRKKGSVVKSIEINTAVILLTAFFLLKITGKFMYQHLSELLKYYLSNSWNIQINSGSIMTLGTNIFFSIVLLTLPILASIVVAIIVANILQFGFLLTLEPIKPNLGKLNIIKGFQNLFSKKSLETLVKSLLKILLVGYIAYSTITKDIPIIINFFFINVEQSWLIFVGLAMEILYKIVIAFIVLAAIDFFVQKWTMDNQMKMSKQEIKEEHKRTEGDPLIKAEIKRRQHEMARSRMMSEVPKADVVITNPFHVAIAIKYDAKTMHSPKVIAKGLRQIAENIKAIARENNIPLVENPPVARALYKSTKVGQDIPSDLYSAVAEILTYIYKLSGKTFGI